MDENKIIEGEHKSEDMKEIIALLKKISKQLDELKEEEYNSAMTSGGALI